MIFTCPKEIIGSFICRLLKKKKTPPSRQVFKKKSNKVQKFKQSETVKSSECHKLCEVIKAPLFACWAVTDEG